MLNRYFDHIFCINLLRRTDRLEHSINEFKRIGIEVEFIEAIDAKDLILPIYPDQNKKRLKPGARACSLSHLKCLELALERGYNRFLILEDDCIFRDDIQEYFGKHIREVPDWDMLSFCNNHLKHPTYVNPEVRRITEAYSAMCYAMTKEMAVIAVKNIKELYLRRAVDVVYSILHGQHNCYCFKENIVWSLPNVSDIQGGFQEYLLLKPGKNDC